MRQTYWFTCPRCGAGRESEYIENYCNHGNEIYVMNQGGKVFVTTAPLSSFTPSAAHGESLSKEKS